MRCLKSQEPEKGGRCVILLWVNPCKANSPWIFELVPYGTPDWAEISQDNAALERINDR